MTLRAFQLKLSGYWRKIKFRVGDILLTFFDKILLLLSVSDRSLFVDDKQRKTIVVSGLDPNFRVAKYIKWLSTTGQFDFILAVHQSSKLFGVEPKYFKKIIKYRNTVHLQRMVKESNADAGIAFASKPSYALALIESASFPVIFDPYDCVVIYYGTEPHLSWMKTEVVSERLCFQKADYILARNLECRQSAIIYQASKKPSILFSDYCDNDFMNDPEPLSISGESPISLVYSGGLYGKSVRSSSHGIENFDDLVDCLGPNKIDLHLYPNPFSPPEYYYDFVVEAHRLPYLHIYPSIAQKELSEKLSTYHFGILPHFKDPDSKVLDIKLRYGTSNKFFNFLEAGLPIIVSDEMTYMAWMIKRYDIGIVISRHDLKNLREIIANSDYAKLQQNVLAVREKLSMKANLGRLVRFMDSVR